MRKKMTSKKIVAIGLSLLMLGSSESVQILAESLESESAITVEETSTEVNSVEEVASVAELAEPTELETLPVSEESSDCRIPERLHYGYAERSKSRSF